jgi:hypothetical protein
MEPIPVAIRSRIEVEVGEKLRENEKKKCLVYK